MFTSLTWAGSLPNGTSGQSYSQTVGSLALEVGENSSTYAWAFVGAAPFSGAGLSATLFGVGGGSVVCTLKGTPSSSGTKTFTVKVRHLASGSEQTHVFSVVIAAAAPPPDGDDWVVRSTGTFTGTVGTVINMNLGYYAPRTAPKPTLTSDVSLHFNAQPNITLSERGWELGLTGTPTSILTGTVSFSVKRPDGSVVDSWTRPIAIAASATPPVTVTVTAYTAPAMTVGTQYQYTVGQVIQPTATAAQAVWTLDSAHADYAKLPAGTSLTSAGKLTIRPANTTDIKVPFKVTVPHPTAGQAALIYTGLFPITDITAATPTPSVTATINSFPQATVGVAYSRTVGTITVPSSGGTWSLADRGTLPSGATLSSAGVLATTFTEAGTKTAQVKASASGYLQTIYPISITVGAAPGVGEIVYSLNALPNSSVGSAYSQALGTVSTPASGATWSISSRGNLPSGAALSSAGVLTATFTAVQTYTFTAKISANGYTDQSVPIAVQCVGLPAIVLQRAAARALVVDQLESVLLLTVTVPPSNVAQFVLTRETLPSSLTILQQGNLLYLQGTPDTPGDFTFSITISAAGYATRKEAFQVSVIAASQIQVMWAELPPAQPAVAYSHSLGTVTAPSSGAEWALSGRGNLPAAATVSTAGVLGATLPTAQIYRFTVSITAPDYPLRAQVIELPCGENSKAVKVTQPTYPNATVNVAYTASLGTVSDPPSGATWALTTRGTLPAGATVSSTGQLSATFAAVGSYQGTVTVSASGYVSTTLTVKITAVASGGTGTIAVAMASLPSATVSRLYAKSLGTVTAPTSGATWSISALGTLPSGAYVAPDGILSFTAAAPGTGSGTVKISANGYTPITRTVTVTVIPDAGPPQVEVFQPSGYAHPVVNEPYATSLGIVNAPSTGATWELTTQGTLPEGATLTGPTFAATFPSTGSFTGEATVSATGYTSLVLPLRFTVDANSNLPMTVTVNSLPAATTGVAYSRTVGTITVPSSGGTWSLEDRGTLPSGATLSSAGVLATTFTTAGTFTGTARASASGYASTMATLSVIAATPAPATLTYEWFNGLVYVENVEVRNVFGMILRPKSSGRFTLADRGTFPANTQISSETLREFPTDGRPIYHGTVGVITGTFAPGTYQGTIRIDAPGYSSDERTLTVTAGPQSGTEIIVSTFSGVQTVIIHQPSALYVGHVVYPPVSTAPVLTWTLTDRGTLPDNAVLASDGLDGGLLTFTPTQLGTLRATAEVSTPDFTSASLAIEILVVSADDPPVIVDPPDPPDPPGGGGWGGGGWGGGNGGGCRKPPKPPVVIDDLGATWVVRHTAHDDGTGGLAPTLNSLGTVDYGAGHLYFQPTFNYIVKRWSAPNAGGTGVWVYQEIPDVFGNDSEVTVTYVPDTVEPEEVTAYLPPPSLEVDLTPFNADAVIPGSVKFTIGSAVFQDYEGVVVMNPDANGIGTEAGTISYQTGKVVLHTWQAGDPTFALQALATVSGRYTDTAMRFRVASAPLRPSGFTVAATALDGELLSGTVDLLGIISGNGIAGTLDTEYGLCNLLFGEYVLDSTLTDEQKAEEWYDAGDILPNGTIWQPRKVFPSSVRYNAVAYTSVPVSADILGLDPVRLPSDGRVPIFVKGQLALVHQTSSLVENTLSPTQVLDTGEERLYRVALTDALGQLIGADQYVLDRAAGTVTMNANWSSAPYTAPFTLRYTIADLRIISAVDLSGKITFNRALSHAYAQDDAKLSGVLYLGTLQARVTNVFTQAAWTGEWQDTVIGTPPLARYNDVQYPIQVNNRNAYPDRFLVKFTSATEFQIIGENLGVIGTGSIAQDCSPVNSLTGYPYFTIPYQGWGSGWATGNGVRFNVVGACYPVDCARAIQPSEPSSLPDGATLLLIGNVDA